MKKHLFLFAAAAVALASCSSDDTIAENSAAFDSQQKEISIKPLNQKATRTSSETTTAIDGATYPNNLIMQVAAYAFPPSSTTWTAGSYFEKTPFDGTGSNWTGDPKRYWPLTDAYVTFLAVAGVETADISFESNPYGSAATVTYDATSSAGKFDLIYAGKQEHVAKNGNSLTYPDDVDMVFKHALSWLQFNVKAASSDYASKIKVSKIVINDATQTGSFAITNTGYNTVGNPTPSGVWTPDAGAAYTVNDNSSPTPITLTNANQALGTALLVPNSSAFTSFTIYYSIDDTEFTFDYTPASLELAQATKYIYDITFTLTEIIIDPEVLDWTAGGTTDIDIPTLAIGTSATYAQPAYEGTYTLKITGLTGSGAPTIDASDSATPMTIPTATAPSTGATTVTYTIPANTADGASRTFSFTVKDDGGSGGSDKVSTITITQAAGPDYVAP